MAWIFDIKCPTTSVGSILDTVSEDTEDTAYASILSVYIKDTFSAYLYINTMVSVSKYRGYRTVSTWGQGPNSHKIQ